MSTPFKMKGFSGFGNSPVKQSKKTDIDYEKMLNEMGGNSVSDTLVSGSSKSESTANKKANFNYRQASNKPYKNEKTTQNTKTGKYTTYKVGPK